MKGLWVAVLYVSPRTADKISQRHRITEFEVRQAVVCVEGLTYVWDDDELRGLRAIVEAPIRNEPALIVLYPRSTAGGDPGRNFLGGSPGDADEYNLGSAHFKWD